MALSRIQHAARISHLPFLYPCNPYQLGAGPVRRAMMSAYRPADAKPDFAVDQGTGSGSSRSTAGVGVGGRMDTPDVVVPESSGGGSGSPIASGVNAQISSDAAAPQVAAAPPPVPKRERAKPKIRSSKAALSITPTAVERLRGLLKGPTPQLIRIGVRNKGCAGLSYHLEYVDKPGRFDEVVEQDGVQVLIDSKALFSIIGSEMDWQEDALSSKFAFKNPNIKDACGCGESFTIG